MYSCYVHNKSQIYPPLHNGHFEVSREFQPAKQPIKCHWYKIVHRNKTFHVENYRAIICTFAVPLQFVCTWLSIIGTGIGAFFEGSKPTSCSVTLMLTRTFAWITNNRLATTNKDNINVNDTLNTLTWLSTIETSYSQLTTEGEFKKPKV